MRVQVEFQDKTKTKNKKKTENGEQKTLMNNTQNKGKAVKAFHTLCFFFFSNSKEAKVNLKRIDIPVEVMPELNTAGQTFFSAYLDVRSFPRSMIAC